MADAKVTSIKEAGARMKAQVAVIGPTSEAIAKAGIAMMTRQYCRYLGPHNVRVNAIAPSLVEWEQHPIEDLSYLLVLRQRPRQPRPRNRPRQRPQPQFRDRSRRRQRARVAPGPQP